MSYSPIPEKYLRSVVQTENTDDAYIWVVNELYPFLLTNWSITKTIYETKDKKAYLDLVSSFVRKVPVCYYNIDFENDWTLAGENNEFMSSLRTAYAEYVKLAVKYKINQK